MTRFPWATAFLALVLVFLTPAWILAHEGHGGAEVGPYDLDTPRAVTPETAAHIGLQTAEVDFGVVEEVLTLSGVVRASPDRHWTVSTRTAGKVTAIHVQIGQAVRRGEPLVEIDSPELARNVYEARKLETEYQKLLVDLARAEGRVRQLGVEVETSEQTAVLAETELARSESAGESAVGLNVLAERRGNAMRLRGEARLRAVDLSVAEEEAAALRKQASSLSLSRDALLALSNVEPAQLDGENGTEPRAINLLVLRAPADGVVVDRVARPGHWAAAGEALLSVADYSAVQIEGELPESLIARVTGRTSDKVRIRAAADPAFLGAGTIRFISPALDEIKRTAHVLIDAPNPAGTLREGMFVDLAIVLRENVSAVVVPISAVVQDGPVHFVFVKEGDVYKKQDINPGLRNDQVVEVLAGLAPGDIVVSQGAYSLTQLRPKTTPTVAAVSPKPEAGLEQP